MTTLRKITVQVPEDDLEAAQAYTGEGVAETVRTGLKALGNIPAQRDLLSLRHDVKFAITLDELRRDRD